MFVPVTAEQVPALRQAGLLWCKHPWDAEFRASKPLAFTGEAPYLRAYQHNIDHGSIYAILLED